MSVNDQITRIKNNVTNSLSAVQEKGVSVPADANSDNLPALIAQISGGDATVEEITNSAGGKSVYINSEVPKLPEGYEELEYIQSNGSQYVDTGFKPNNNTRVTVDIDLSTRGGVLDRVFGAWSSSNKDAFIFMKLASNLPRFYFGTSYKDGSADISGRHIIDANKNEVYVDGILDITAPAATFTCSNSLFLLEMNNVGTIAGTPVVAKIYACQIYDNGTLVRYYVPCKSDTGEIGLWDAVNNTFTGDAAGVGFIAGPRKNVVLPDGYTRLKWIQSTGSQYINTGINSTYTMRMDIMFANNGARNLMGRAPNAGCYFGTNASGVYELGGTYVSKYSGTVRRKILIVDTDADISLTAADETISRAKASTATEQIELRLLGGFADYPCSATLYGCQIDVGEQTVRDYVPCLNASGTVGLYDMVNGVFYGDAAGGTFLAGPEHTVAVSKVVLENRTLIDLTGDTIGPETVLAGFIGHDKTGAQFVGELVQKAGGRPFACGTATRSAMATLSVTGLSFKPVIVFLVCAAYPGITFAFADKENSKMVYHNVGYNAMWGVYEFSRRQDMTATFSDGSFVFQPQSASFTSSSYEWYAIGAEG